jgi:hypothetical protein
MHPIFTSLDFVTMIFFYEARLSALRTTPNREGQVPVFMSPNDSVVPLQPQTPGSLSVDLWLHKLNNRISE